MLCFDSTVGFPWSVPVLKQQLAARLRSTSPPGLGRTQRGCRGSASRGHPALRGNTWGPQGPAPRGLPQAPRQPPGEKTKGRDWPAPGARRTEALGRRRGRVLRRNGQRGRMGARLPPLPPRRSLTRAQRRPSASRAEGSDPLPGPLREPAARPALRATPSPEVTELVCRLPLPTLSC